MTNHQELVLDSPFINRRTFIANNPLFDQPSKIFILFDLILIVSLYQIGVYFSPFNTVIWGTIEVLSISFIHAFITVVVNTGLGYYDFNRRFDLANIIFNPLLSNTLAIMGSVSIAYFGFYSSFGRLSIAYGVGASYFGILIFRLGLRKYILSNPYTITCIGDSDLITKIRGLCSNRRLFFNCIFVRTEIENIAKTLNTLLDNRVKTLICSSDIVQHQNFVDLSVAASQSGITLTDDIEFYTYLFEHIPIDKISKRWLLHMGLSRQSNLYLMLKRAFDIFFSLSFLIILSPLIIFLSLAIKLTSKGPILFIQPRLGRFSQPFNIYKFRTMAYRADHTQAGPDVTAKNDNRITSLGKILRPLHLDEIPQLLNILKGDMSLVGVRPETIPYAEKMRDVLPIYQLRDIFRPGITGHAQLSMPYPMHVLEDTKNKLGYDFYYLVNQGFFLDLKIVFYTFFRVFFPVFYKKISPK